MSFELGDNKAEHINQPTLNEEPNVASTIAHELIFNEQERIMQRIQPKYIHEYHYY